MSAWISSAVRAPARLERRVAAHRGQPGGAVERHPAHQLRRDVVLRVAARLPDALVGLAPDAAGALGLGLDDRPQPPRKATAALRVQQDRVEHGAVDVVLALVERAVADPDGPGARVSRQLVARRLSQVAAPVDPVHDLEPAVLVRLDVGDELHELVRLPVEVEEVQRLQGECRVAHPRVAVVPVALAARGLGERGGQCRHGRAGRHVGEPLDHQRRALNVLAEAVIGLPPPGEPAAPEAAGGGETGVRVVDVLGRREPVLPRQRAERLLALREDVARAHPVGLDAERQVGAQPHGHSGPGGVGRMAVVADHRPLAGRAPVVEVRLADQLELHLALEAQRHPYEQVLGVLVRRRTGVRRHAVVAARRADGQRVAHDQPACRRVPGGGQDVRARLVDARRRHVDPVRREPEAARLAVEQGPEHARGVKARHAQPVDRAVGGDERARVAVREERVLRDRRERRRCGGARAHGASASATSSIAGTVLAALDLVHRVS